MFLKQAKHGFILVKKCEPCEQHLSRRFQAFVKDYIIFTIATYPMEIFPHRR